MVTVEQAKEWLKRYKYLMSDIAVSEERAESIKDSLGTRSVNLDGMPRNSSPVKDRIGHLTAVYVDIEKDIENKYSQAWEIYKEIDRTIEILTGFNAAEMKAVLRLRYLDLDRRTWNDISEALYISDPNYLEREDSFLRRTHSRHKAALETIAELIPAPIEAVEVG